MNRKLLALTAGTAILAVAGTATLIVVAAPGHFAHAHPDGGRDGVPMLFEQADTDNDGKLSVAEVEAARDAMFARMDADGDGRVTEAEVDTFAEEARARHRARRFSRADADGDGAISADEFAARWDERVSRMDRDGDGVIVPGEGRRHGHGGRHSKHD